MASDNMTHRREAVLLFVGNTASIPIKDRHHENSLREDLYNALKKRYETPATYMMVDNGSIVWGTHNLIGFYFRDIPRKTTEQLLRELIETTVCELKEGEAWKTT